MGLRLETVRARAGANLLDILVPGWAERIDLAKLDMSSCDVCVLGQLFGEYTKGAEILFAMRSQKADAFENERFNEGVKLAANEAGFACDRSPTGTKYVKWGSYSNLTTAWKREITKRQPVKTEKVPAGAGVYCDTCGHYRCPTPVDETGTRKTVDQPVR